MIVEKIVGNVDAMIEVKHKNGHVKSIVLDGYALGQWVDTDIWILPKDLIGNQSVNGLPQGSTFEVCAFIEDDMVYPSDFPFRLQKIGLNKVRLFFFDSRPIEKRNHGTFILYMEAKRAVIKERASEVGDVSLEDYSDDDTRIRPTFTATVEVEIVAEAVQLAEQFIAEVEGAIEMRLGAGFWVPRNAESEKEFTQRTVLPILRKIGFQNVKYNHGKREFGRDILFSRITEFKDIEFWGAQIKFGDIAGGAGAEIDKLIDQIDDAFKMPFYDLYTKQKQRISKLAIIISGKFTENAIEKTCEKIESAAVRNNIVFLDGEKLQSLAEGFRVAVA